MQPLLLDDLGEERLPVLEKITSGGANLRVVEDLRVLTFQIPGGEEETPIDEGGEVADRYVVDDAPTEKTRLGDRPVGLGSLFRRRLRRQELERGGIRASFCDSEQRLRFAALVESTQFFLLVAVRRREVLAAFFRKEIRDDVHRA